MKKSGKAAHDAAHDKAVEHTFPASDPIASKSETATEPLGSDPKRKPPVITKEQVAAAAVKTEDCPTCHGATIEASICPRCGGSGRVVSAETNISPVVLSV